MPDASTSFSLREYLDVQFSGQNRKLADIESLVQAGATSHANLIRDHYALERCVTEHKMRLEALEAAGKAAEDFRRRALFAGVPVAVSVVGYLLLQFVQMLARHGVQP